MSGPGSDRTGPGPHFVVGMPRAGTTFVVHRLNEHPDVCCFGESRFWGNDWVEPDEHGRYDAERLRQVRAKLVANHLDTNVGELGPEPDRPGWMKTLGRPELAALVRQTFDGLQAPTDPGTVFRVYASAIAGAEGKRLAVEKTPQHVRHVDRIRSWLPDARFVVMIRGPEEFLLSYKHKGDTKSVPKREAAERRWHPIGVSLLWRSYLRHALGVASRLGDAALLVRNEDLGADPAGVMTAVQEFLDVEPVDLVPDTGPRTNTSFAGDRPRLDAAEHEWCRRIAGTDAAAAGYALARRSAGAVPMAKQAVTVVPWAARNAIAMRRLFDVPLVDYTRRAFGSGDQRS